MLADGTGTLLGVQGLTVVAAIAAAAAAAGNWWSRVRISEPVELVTKPVATIAIAALAISVAGDAPNGAVVAAIIGFASCLAGDVALLPAVDQFVVGLGSFLVGHIAFVVMFVLLGLDRPWLGAVAGVAVLIVAAVVGRRIIAGARAKDGALFIPVCAYLSVISSMAIVGWATGRPWAIVGSSLFVLSDSILGWGEFVKEHRWTHVSIMVTYHAALLGLALSLI